MYYPESGRVCPDFLWEHESRLFMDLPSFKIWRKAYLAASLIVLNTPFPNRFNTDSRRVNDFIYLVN